MDMGDMDMGGPAKHACKVGQAHIYVFVCGVLILPPRTDCDDMELVHGRRLFHLAAIAHPLEG
jgi:hypothetical protein